MPSSDSTRPIETAANRPDIGNSRCKRCGAEFRCGMNGETPCWCAAYPHVLPVPQEGTGCYCPVCLAALTAPPGKDR